MHVIREPINEGVSVWNCAARGMCRTCLSLCEPISDRGAFMHVMREPINEGVSVWNCAARGMC